MLESTTGQVFFYLIEFITWIHVSAVYSSLPPLNYYKQTRKDNNKFSVVLSFPVCFRYNDQYPFFDYKIKYDKAAFVP